MDFRKGNKSRSEPEINLIPFIDVLLVILIFLMITTTYNRFAELQINLPQEDANVAQDHPKQILIGVDSRGNYKINDKPVAKIDVADLAESLKKAAGELGTGSSQADPIVVIRADALASHQSVMDVLDAARQAGLSKVTFATVRHD